MCKGLSLFYVDSLGGGGVRKMPILLNKISTKGGRGGVKKVQNLVYVENGCPQSPPWKKDLQVTASPHLTPIVFNGLFKIDLRL